MVSTCFTYEIGPCDTEFAGGRLDADRQAAVPLVRRIPWQTSLCSRRYNDVWSSVLAKVRGT